MRTNAYMALNAYHAPSHAINSRVRGFEPGVAVVGVHGLIGGCVLWETTRCTWVCTDDQVYMGDHELCKQYVLSDFGNIFYGNQQEISAKPWNYGQVLHVYCVYQAAV